MSVITQRRRRIYELCIFAMLGTIMFCSDLLMELLPNIHLVGVLTMVYTLVFRAKALIPVYVYVFLLGLFFGFDLWWVPYLYIWTILWGITMLLPKRMPIGLAAGVYATVCGLHGLAFGTLYAPAQALMFGLNFEQMLAWIALGFTFDITHMFGNIALSALTIPLSELIKKLNKKVGI